MRLRVRTNGDVKGWGIDGCQRTGRSTVEGVVVSEQRQVATHTRRPLSRLALALAVAAAGTIAVSPPAYADDPIPDPIIPPGLVEPMNMGGGTTSGTIEYSPVLPVADARCKPVAFTLQNDFLSEAFVFNSAIAGYVGPVTITGQGSSSNGSSPGCESYGLGGGTMTVALEGFNPTTESTLTCPSLVGTYTRVLSDMTVVLSGDCKVNDFTQGIGRVLFAARIQVVPTGMNGAGFLVPVSTATTAGNFVVAPA